LFDALQQLAPHPGLVAAQKLLNVFAGPLL
jgi:hypothetical protein